MVSKEKSTNEHKKPKKRLIFGTINRLANIATFLLISIFLIVFLFFTIQTKLIYRPKNYKLDYAILENVQLDKENYQVYVQENGSNVDFIVFGGAGIDYKAHVDFVERLTKNFKFNMILPFHRGFGQSKGHINEITAMTDLIILQRIMKKRNNHVVIYGHSFGSASALYYSKLANVGHVVLENPFYCATEVMKINKYLFFSRFILTENWPNYKFIECSQNVLFLISENDDIILRENSNKLAKLCKNHKKVLLLGMNHCDAYFKHPHYYVYIHAFIYNYPIAGLE